MAREPSRLTAEPIDPDARGRRTGGRESMTCDEELLQRWSAGDPRAGNELCERYLPTVVRIFHHRVGVDALEDLVQRTFLACVRYRDRVDGDGFRPYLLKIAYNLLRRHFREQAAGRACPLEGSVGDDATSPSVRVDRQQRHERLVEALRGLSFDTQCVLELHYWEGLSGAQIAAALDLPEGTVRSRLRLGRTALRRQLCGATETTKPSG